MEQVEQSLVASWHSETRAEGRPGPLPLAVSLRGVDSLAYKESPFLH